MSAISEIQIIPIKPTNGLVGFASFVLNNSFYCGSVGIFTRPNGDLRLTYPTKKVGAKNINIFYPINREMADSIEKEVIQKFNEITNNYGSGKEY